MEGICGALCDGCKMLESKKCKGCKKSNGCPFGKKCFIANYIEIGGKENYEKLKEELKNEINSLNIDGMPKVKELYPLNGLFVNLEYTLPNNKKEKFLDDKENYLGVQIECDFNNNETKKYFGIVCNLKFILVSEYDEGGLNPEIIIYKRR